MSQTVALATEGEQTTGTRTSGQRTDDSDGTDDGMDGQRTIKARREGQTTYQETNKAGDGEGTGGVTQAESK